jgi:aerobic carbon-monoxide dehydrogenase small subunit
MTAVKVSTTINGDPVDYVCEPDETLLDVLRNRLGLTGAKEGCSTGDCGACSVTIDGRLTCSCLVLGICTPGFLVAAKSLLDHNPKPTETEVRFALAGNLCRCTGYDKIVRAVMDTAAEMRRA